MKYKSVFIIGGLGRIGLTAAAVLSEYYDIVLYDTNQQAICKFKEENKATFHEPGLKKLLATRNNISIASFMDKAAESDVILITIGTAIDEYMNPRLKDLFKIADKLSEVLTNQLVILRSTVYPGITKKFEKRMPSSVTVAFCPERVAGGKMIKEMTSLPQIISANNPDAIAEATSFFSPLGIKLKYLYDTTAGEFAKLMTNSYRYIEFAMANQFFCMAQDAGCDFYEILYAMKDDYPRMKNFPAPGFSGSYCLRKDTLQLAAWNKGMTFNLGHDAALVNEGLPLFVFRQMRKKYDVANMTIGLLGMTFKGNTDDTRDSLSFRMKKILENECKKVLCHDPYVNAGNSARLEEILESSDLLILMTLHDEYRGIKTTKPIIDIWNFYGKGTGL